MRISIRYLRRSSVAGTLFNRTASSTTKLGSKSGRRGDSIGNTVGLIIFSGMCVGTGALGVWQVQRYYWKLDVIAEGTDKIGEQTQVLPRFSSQEQLAEFAESNKGKQVQAVGTFEHNKELLMGLRTAPVSMTGPAQGMASNPQGYYVVTPFRLQDGSLVFVNRGWVPRNQKAWSRPSAAVSLRAVIAQQEKSGFFAPVNSPQSGKLFWLESAALLNAYNNSSNNNNSSRDRSTSTATTAANSTTANGVSSSSGDSTAKIDDKSVVIFEALQEHNRSEQEQVTASAVAVYPYARKASELQQQHITPLTHLVYAITWFSLSAAGVVMTYIKFLR